MSVHTLAGLLTIVLLSHLSSAEHGDYVNQFVAQVVGGNEQLQQVVSHLEKRSAKIISTVNSEKFGNTVHFKLIGVHTRSKRSSEGHHIVSSLADHPHIISIEQETELIRDKRDYLSQEQIDEARRVIQRYLQDAEKRQLLKTNSKYPGTSNLPEYVIRHDKQLELDEPRFYEDKDVFKRFKLNEGEEGIVEQREYNPDEDRCSAIELNDVYWNDQWYLNNCGQAGGPKGLDINVVPAWQQGFSGRNVSVCILDDGIEHDHDDLRANYWAAISSDFNTENSNDHDPTPNPDRLDENSHGTRCAGEIAAQANNSVCGVGVAFNSRIGGVRILDGPVTDSLEASALLFQNQLVDIYSASWGPRDNGQTMEAPGKYCAEALKKGVEEGRGGKGSIFVWATGNGGYNDDDCAADGYVSSPYTLSIGSINNYAESTYFMECCPSTLAVIYTGGYHTRQDALNHNDADHPILKIVSTDVRNKCTLNFQGTSSAAPLAAGVMALALEANPDLTWRDIQHIVIRTSKLPNTVEGGWTINGAGYHVNDKFGYGALDAAQIVQEAQVWSNVAPQHTCVVQSKENLNQYFDVGKPAELFLDTDACQKNADHRIDKLEHVQMYIRLKHPRRGDVSITLTSPAGTSSEMLSRRRNDNSTDGIDFTFMTVRCWDENPRGMWKLTVRDTASESKGGGVVDTWSLTLLGTSQSAKTRSASDPAEKKAFIPDSNDLDQLMKMESDAAVNVDIRKGDETVMEQFAGSGNIGFSGDKEDNSNKEDHSSPGSNNDIVEKPSAPAGVDDSDNSDDDDLTKKVKYLIDGMSDEDIRNVINKLRTDLEIAKRQQEKREQEELMRRVREFLNEN